MRWRRVAAWWGETGGFGRPFSCSPLQCGRITVGTVGWSATWAPVSLASRPRYLPLAPTGPDPKPDPGRCVGKRRHRWVGATTSVKVSLVVTTTSVQSQKSKTEASQAVWWRRCTCTTRVLRVCVEPRTFGRAGAGAGAVSLSKAGTRTRCCSRQVAITP